VVTVPGYFCRNFGHPPERPSAALIVGGSVDPRSIDAVATVELFGCQGEASDSIRVKDFPYSVYVAGGAYLEGSGEVLVCGGQVCDDANICTPTDACHRWIPSEDRWETASTLLADRSNFAILPFDDEGRLIAVGSSSTTELYDPETGDWTNHRNIADASTWFGLACLVEVGDEIYSIRREIKSLNVTSWRLRSDYDPLPTSLQLTGQCSTMDIEGESGIFLSNG